MFASVSSVSAPITVVIIPPSSASFSRYDVIELNCSNDTTSSFGFHSITRSECHSDDGRNTTAMTTTGNSASPVTTARLAARPKAPSRISQNPNQAQSPPITPHAIANENKWHTYNTAANTPSTTGRASAGSM